MKRDMDLIREILRKIEEHPRAHEWFQVDVPGHDQEEIRYHVRLLADAGLVDAKEHSSGSGPAHFARGLTWKGHEFVEASRDDKRWTEAKATVIKTTGGLVFDLVKEVLIEGAKRTLLGG